MKIRTRFAPSPTGSMHVGNLRTALYSYLIAKHEITGNFILRIEDTDQKRYVKNSIDIIYSTLMETGIVWDEGPDKDKCCGPYVQSERQKKGIYIKYAKKLIEKGYAYYCFCNKKILENCNINNKNFNNDIVRYDKHCLLLSKDEIEFNLKTGKPYVIRMNIPNEGYTSFQDEIYGTITVKNSELDDMILIKSDGYPTYNFANVIDDHLMGITHVVRGNEYLSSSPKYNRLYYAFGWDVPVYIHCPLITDENHNKLSKRNAYFSYKDLIEDGFLPEAIINYVALLGWSPNSNKEIFSLKEMIEEFDYKRINKSQAVFDINKMKWMNGEYIRAMEFDDFYKKALPYMKKVLSKNFDYKNIANMIKSRIEVLSDIPKLISFFNELHDYDTSLYINSKIKIDKKKSLNLLNNILKLLENINDYSNDNLFNVLKEYAIDNGLKINFVMWPIRIAISGLINTPGGATELMSVIGKNESLSRIKIGIKKLLK